MNLEIREFTQTIIQFVNQSLLPIEVKRLCINDIAAQLSTAADTQIQAEITARQKAESEGKNEFTENP